MQATTTPKLADHRPAYQLALVAVALAGAIAVGSAIGIALQASAPAAPATGDYEASGVRRAPIGALTAPPTDFLDAAGVRRDQSGITGNAVTSADLLDSVGFQRVPATVAPKIFGIERAPAMGGGLVWTGTNPGIGTGGLADDPMSDFNNLGRSNGSGEGAKQVGRHR